MRRRSTQFSDRLSKRRTLGESSRKSLMRRFRGGFIARHPGGRPGDGAVTADAHMAQTRSWRNPWSLYESQDAWGPGVGLGGNGLERHLSRAGVWYLFVAAAGGFADLSPCVSLPPMDCAGIYEDVGTGLDGPSSVHSFQFQHSEPDGWAIGAILSPPDMISSN
jgi:hypothetical protein